MDTVSWEILIWAVSLGALSAVSLPIGSRVGLGTNPRPQFISAMATFGAGAHCVHMATCDEPRRSETDGCAVARLPRGWSPPSPSL